MNDLRKKIAKLSPEQKQKLLARLKEKGISKTGGKVAEKEEVVRFEKGQNFAYRLQSPPNFLKTDFVEIGIDEPADFMVQVEARAASINFRDLMIAMGIYPQTPGVPSVMGSDYAGVVTKVGKGVEEFKEGDKVILLSLGSFKGDHQIDPQSHFCKYMNVYERQVFPMPGTLSFLDAANLPTVFITSYYALIELARVREGERVLIHSATGGVGLAAIELCRWKKCEIFATAGNEQKRNFLRQMGIEHVMDSRSLDFEQQVLEATDGKGVNVVLNTLSGEAMLAGIRALDFFGRFLQIDKKDIAVNNSIPLGEFNKGLSFSAIDLGLLINDGKTLKGIIRELSTLFEQGEIKPVRSTVYPYYKLGEALNYISRSAHLGKLVLDYSEA